MKLCFRMFSPVLRERSSLSGKQLHRLHHLCVMNKFSKVQQIHCPLPNRTWAVSSLQGTEIGHNSCTNAYNVPLNQFSYILPYLKTSSLVNYVTECIFITFIEFIKSLCEARKVIYKKSNKRNKLLYSVSQKEKKKKKMELIFFPLYNCQWQEIIVTDSFLLESLYFLTFHRLEKQLIINFYSVVWKGFFFSIKQKKSSMLDSYAILPRFFFWRW